MVVFRHLAERYQMLRILIYSFHMPLFFVISGVLNKNKKPVRCFQDGILKMVLPTYKVLFFDASLRYLECVFTHTSYPTLIDCVNGLLIHGGVLWNAPVWFLMTLFVCRVVHCLLVGINKNMSTGFATLCVIICTFNVNTQLPQWWLINLIMSYPFFWLGTTEKLHCIMENPEKYSARKCIQIGAIGVIWLFVARWNGYTDINIQSNGRCYLLFLATGVMETLVVVYLSEWIEDGKLADVLKVVGKNSFIILITHYYICRGIIVTGLKYWGIKSNTVIQLVLTILIIGVYYSIFKMIGYCKSQKMKIE